MGIICKKDVLTELAQETSWQNTVVLDWLESTQLAIGKRKFLLNRLFVKQPIPQDKD